MKLLPHPLIAISRLLPWSILFIRSNVKAFETSLPIPFNACYCKKPRHEESLPGLQGSRFLKRTIQRSAFERRPSSFLVTSQNQMTAFDEFDHGHVPSGNRLLEYLNDCHKYIRENNPSGKWRMHVSEKDRKTMIRTLLGDGRWTKAEFNAKLKEYSVQKQWEATRCFLTENFDELTMSAKQLQERGNLSSPTPFQDGLEHYSTKFETQPPAKLFSYMARGRLYQGKFERLLEDLDKPEWLKTYYSIIEEKEDLALIAEYIENFISSQYSSEESANRIESIQKALSVEMLKAPSQPADGGKQSGIQSEIDLMTYLNNEQEKQGDSESKILGPVYLQNQRRGRNPNRKCPYVIELPASVDLHRKTSELDAIVISKSSTFVRIHQIWEAKATLHPMTIGDALNKKGSTLRNLLSYQPSNTETPEPTLFQINGESHVLDNSSVFRFGIFGKRLLDPAQGVNRMIAVLGEALLESCPAAVEGALTKGYVSIPDIQLLDEIDRMIQVSELLNATMVISSDLAKT
mmetsp:Transcript_96278/g.277921  ORF Transcript_96278/g.277921 Transcript_96278/m.277921 type:complete len:519 (+) Transcript_96278:64-1620(+)